MMPQIHRLMFKKNMMPQITFGEIASLSSQINV